MDKSHMMWGTEVYKDGVKVPRVTYRCKSDHKGTNQTHNCKRVTDHDDLPHLCICGDEW